jgi:hypothetical protein
MTSIRLIGKIDNNTGELGLSYENMVVMTNYPTVSSSGMLVAHDILEHQNGIKSIGSIGDELEALGGMWYVRGRFGSLGGFSIHSPERNIAADVANMANMHFRGVPIRNKRINTRSHYQDESFNEIIEIAKDSYLSDMKDEIEDGEEIDPLCDYFEQSLHLFRTGYRKAEKRFKNVCANSMFRNIEYAVDGIIKHLEYEGQQFVLTYTADNAYCDEYFEEEYY